MSRLVDHAEGQGWAVHQNRDGDWIFRRDGAWRAFGPTPTSYGEWVALRTFLIDLGIGLP